MALSLGINLWPRKGGAAGGGVPGASDVIGLVGRSGSVAGDRPWKIMGDASIAQLSAGEYPDPLTGAINGADVFFFKRVDGTIGMFCGDNATIGVNVAYDGFLKTTALTTYSTASIAAAKNAARMSCAVGSTWGVYTQALRQSSNRLLLGSLSATGYLEYVAHSSDDGVNFTDVATVGGVAGSSGNIIADGTGFVCYFGTTPGPFTSIAAGQMSVSFDYGQTFTTITNVPAGNPIQGTQSYATSGIGQSMGICYDSANSRLIMVVCQRPIGGAGNHMIFTLPSGSLGSAWTVAKTNFVAQGAGDCSVCTSAVIIGSYVYVSYKRATDDAAAHLYRAALSDLTTWTDVATLTSCTASIADPFLLADNKLYVVAGGSGVWTSADGSAASWSRILTSGSAFNLCKVRD